MQAKAEKTRNTDSKPHQIIIWRPKEMYSKIDETKWASGIQNSLKQINTLVFRAVFQVDSFRWWCFYFGFEMHGMVSIWILHILFSPRILDLIWWTSSDWMKNINIEGNIQIKQMDGNKTNVNKYKMRKKNAKRRIFSTAQIDSENISFVLILCIECHAVNFSFLSFVFFISYSFQIRLSLGLMMWSLQILFFINLVQSKQFQNKRNKFQAQCISILAHNREEIEWNSTWSRKLQSKDRQQKKRIVDCKYGMIAEKMINKSELIISTKYRNRYIFHF